MSRAHDHRPPNELAAGVAALWSFDTTTDGCQPFRVLPDGSTDLLLRFDECAPGEPAPPPAVFVVGAADAFEVNDFAQRADAPADINGRIPLSSSSRFEGPKGKVIYTSGLAPNGYP